MLWILLACAHSLESPPAPASPLAPAAPLVVDAEPAEPTGPHRLPVGLQDADPELLELIEAARTSDTGLARLAELCDDYPRRLAGSPQLEGAVQWTRSLFEADGQEAVRLDEVMVPHWIRGEERLVMTAPDERELAVLALGNSVGTDGVVSGEVVVVRSFEELGPEVAGKIVLYNVPMETSFPTIQHYGSAVEYRGQGASRAAAHGAIASLVRSVATYSLYTPHTGAMRYDEEQPQIPAAAISVEDADLIDRLTARGKTVTLELELGARFEEDAVSHNVLAELRGSESPDEIVVIGAHLDAWDVGRGAWDDGAGVIQTIEALRLMRELGLQPRRTIRAVLFTNEENGLRGGKDYSARHGGEDHLVAMESDLGAGWPQGFGMSGTVPEVAWVRATLAPLGLPVADKGGGADIGPLHRDHGVPVIGIRPDDTRYFHVHHTEADTFDKVEPEAFREATAAFAGAAWLLANAEEPPRKAGDSTDR